MLSWTLKVDKAATLHLTSDDVDRSYRQHTKDIIPFRRVADRQTFPGSLFPTYSSFHRHSNPLHSAARLTNRSTPRSCRLASRRWNIFARNTASTLFFTHFNSGHSASLKNSIVNWCESSIKHSTIRTKYFFFSVSRKSSIIAWQIVVDRYLSFSKFSSRNCRKLLMFSESISGDFNNLMDASLESNDSNEFISNYKQL